MASIILLVLIPLISWVAPSNAINGADFLDCISNQSYGNIGIRERIYMPDSTSYLNFLKSASQNRRWMNIKSQRPSFIAVPLVQTEIRHVIICGKEFGFQIRVKSGGHDYEGLSFRSKTPFIMVDLVNLNSVTIDVTEETAWIETGATLGQLYYEIANKSNTLAFPGGIYQTVGSGGHISGGGLGTLLRKYGLAADNVLDARIMDVNGKILNRKSMGKDLFWAIRGGGGASFGVILAWKLKLVRVPEQVTSFRIFRKLDPENLDLLQKWQNNAYKLPNDLFIRTLFRLGQAVKNHVQIVYQGLFLGTVEELVPLLNKFFPEFNLQTKDCFEAPHSNCVQTPWIRSVLFFMFKHTDMSPETLMLRDNNSFSTLQKATSDFLKVSIPNHGWKMINHMLLSEHKPMMIFDPFGGKMDEIGENETPFPHRNGTLFSVQYVTNWEVSNEQEARKHIKWIRKLYRKMKPYVSRSPRAAYVNYKDLELGKNDQNCSYSRGKVWGEKYFKGNFERLARVKGKIDPGNFFKNEQSIPVYSDF